MMAGSSNRILVFCLLLLAYQATYCENRGNNKTVENGASFSGVIRDKKAVINDSLCIIFLDDLMSANSFSGKSFMTKRFYVKVNEDGVFHFRLPLVQEIGKITFQIWGSKKMQLNDPGYPYFYVENNDSIHIVIDDLDKDRVNYSLSGTGVNKYLAVKYISQAFNTPPGEDFDNIDAKTSRVVNKSYTHKTLCLELLNHFKSGLNYKLFKLIEADIIGRINFELINNLKINGLLDGQISILKYFDIAETDLDVVILSTNYIKYIIDLCILDFQLTNKRSKYDVGDIYYLLKNKYSGALRDKLITTYLIDARWRLEESGTETSNYNYCLSDAFKIVQHETLRNILGHKFDRYGKGSIAYNFALPDSNGNIIELGDFKGKVVLVDIYATACTGCRIFARTLKQKVFPEFQNNKNVTFIAISQEKDRRKWLKDIEDGFNTSADHEIILYTEGAGSDHPIFKYYGIQTVPTLLLIDRNGRIINSSASTLKANSTGEEVIEMIYKALEP